MGAGRERAERAAWARGVGVPVRAGWACCLVSWASFGAQYTWLSFDSVFSPFRLGIFPSHLMNTVHCKINFRKKKYLLNLIKIKSNQINLIKFSKNKIFKNEIFENKILLKTIF